MENEETNNTTVNTEVLSNIYRTISIKQDLSIDNEIRNEEKKQILNMLVEPLRRTEFDILMALFTKLDHKPYESMKIVDKYCLKMKTIEIELVHPNNVDFLTLDYESKNGFYFFKVKDVYSSFSDGSFIRSDQLYKKLFSLCISTGLKILYYFLSKYKYDFVTILYDRYPNVYKKIEQIDNYFCSQQYHKRITKNIL